MTFKKYNNFKKGGFTLIELLIGITLSAILMTSIIVFVSSSLGSNMATKKTLEEGNKNESFEQKLTEVFGNITGSGIYATESSFGGEYLTGAFLATLGPNLPITFLGLRTLTGYCDSYSGTASETGAVMKLAIRQFTVPTIQNTTNYTLSFTGNAVFSGTTRIIGTLYPGNIITHSGIDTELSSPSALISSGNHLYIADTMNNRVLSYDITSGGIAVLLGAENGIRKPTSLYFSGNTLLIASSGNGKIYSLQDGNGDGGTFKNTFKVAKNFSADNLRFTFSGISNITSPNAPSDITITGDGVLQNTANDVITNGTSLQYTFSGGSQFFTTTNPYLLTVRNISPTPITSGNYTVKVDFLNSGIVQYSDTFHYFLRGDNSLESGTGNILNMVSGGFPYPHAISGANNWSTTIDWATVLGQNPLGNKTLSSLPVQDLSFEVTGKVLTIRYHEYTHYDCLLGKHRTEERIKKVLLQ
ncbi:TPA: hypothetical protein DCZ36_02340 [Candidatus Gracilibacteria bacterium]|nr:hypothetical protein [Candidatus Gracilibacteria bacterium]